MKDTGVKFPYKKCETCKNENLEFSLTHGQCYWCVGTLERPKKEEV